MKLKNVKVGQTVKVKKTFNTLDWGSTFEPESKGLVGTVHHVEPVDYDGMLTVCVEFSDGCTGWGNHKDIKLIEDVD